MKKFLFLLLAVCFIPVHSAHAQLTVVAPVIDALLESKIIADGIRFADQMREMVSQGVQFGMMLENLASQTSNAVQNLASAKDIKGFGDFMEWYNRQLYLEKKAIDKYNGLNITIGKKNYKFSDVESMAYGINETFVEFWDKEFTEEQKREMWLTLGLTPSNYAYVQTWKEKEKEMLKQFITAASVQNDEYMKNMEEINETADKITEDEFKDAEDKMGQKEVQLHQLKTSLNTNKILNDIAYNQAKMMELEAVKMYQEKTPTDQPALSDWREFRKLKF